eukprot:1143164-Pelagomonas_calceolata.AAC.1
MHAQQDHRAKRQKAKCLNQGGCMRLGLSNEGRRKRCILSTPCAKHQEAKCLRWEKLIFCCRKARKAT